MDYLGRDQYGPGNTHVRLARQFRSLQELILVWARDASRRSFEGQGENVFEEVEDCNIVHDHAECCHEDICSKAASEAAVRAKFRILMLWRNNRAWEALGRRDPPVITVMHWRSREGKKC
jgi:hypothetical protein